MNTQAASTYEPIVAVPVTVNLPQVTDAQLAAYAKLIYAKTGIRVAPQKKALLSNRLRHRLKQTGIADFAKYYEHLQRLPSDAPEWDAFLQEITTHETYLFRDERQWTWLREDFLKDLGAAERSGKRPARLRIWSAACSTGDEATTIACCVAASLPNYAHWTIQIVGTDIGIGAVQAAQQAEFGDRAMKLVPPDYRKRFFTRLSDGDRWKARPVITDMMAFQQHNLMEPLKERPFDLVFLKNVLIYFDRDSKRRVVNHVCSSLAPGGMLVAGPADGIAEFMSGYVRLHPWLYQKPVG